MKKRIGLSKKQYPASRWYLASLFSCSMAALNLTPTAATNLLNDVTIPTPVPSRAAMAQPAPESTAPQVITSPEAPAPSAAAAAAISPETAVVHESPVAPIPPSIVPGGDQVLSMTLTARGDQIYECRPIPGQRDKFEWAFKGPEADLFSPAGKMVGSHFTGPTWTLGAEDRVTGRVKVKVEAPDGKGVPWLLLDADKAMGPAFGKVKSIQRINTVGGKPPVEPADVSRAGQQMREHYTATYRFFTSK